MRIQPLGIAGCFLIEHDVFTDERGLFREWFKSSVLEKLGNNFRVAQANFSVSKQGVIRGLHYSLAPSGQMKLITCAYGLITDVLVDIRTGSPTYLKQVQIRLESNSGKTILIDSGVAHGFSVLSEFAAIVYLTSSEYSANFEKSLNPHDIKLAVNWSLPKGSRGILSLSDSEAISFEHAMHLGALPKYSVIS